MIDTADVFLVAGQSNAAGTGDPDRAPTLEPGVAFEFDDAARELVALSEPVGPGDRGSAWTAFASEYYDRTGSPLVIVSKPVDGAAQHSDADQHRGAGDWEAGSECCRDAVDALYQCTTRLRERGITYDFKGVLWHQGESDALAIDEGYHCVSNYRTAFWEMLTYLRAKLNRPELGFYVFKIGRPKSGDTDGWWAVRNAQDAFAEQIENVYVVYDRAVALAEDGRMHDNLHYTQAGYNEMGRLGASTVVAMLQE